MIFKNTTRSQNLQLDVFACYFFVSLVTPASELKMSHPTKEEEEHDTAKTN